MWPDTPLNLVTLNIFQDVTACFGGNKAQGERISTKTLSGDFQTCLQAKLEELIDASTYVFLFTVCQYTKSYNELKVKLQSLK